MVGKCLWNQLMSVLGGGGGGGGGGCDNSYLSLTFWSTDNEG